MAGKGNMKAPASNLEGYDSFLTVLKHRIHQTQVRVAFTISRELSQLYWETGRDFVAAQQQHRWGDHVLKKVAADLNIAFPAVQGFSRANLYRMRAFYLNYPDQDQIVAQAVRQLPWGHNVVLMQRVKDENERLWYAQQILELGWTRPILEMQIQSRLYHRQGKALTNFAHTLPPPQSDLAQQILKDPYHFDFLTLGQDAHEQALERGLLEHLKQFLLELGVGFALVGSQYHLSVGDEDAYVDLLFYHLKLRAFVVIELKAREVQPADVAQVMAYVAIVDEQLRHVNDAPTIGLVLGKGKKAMAEYVLRNVNAPIGIAEYITADALPKNLEVNLPSIAQLEAELARLGASDA
jgi:predicted nuclease of restriction endonuclease-like (RecB) superfamily